MNISDFDEINAYRNTDGTYTIEAFNSYGKLVIPSASFNLTVTGGYGTPSNVELTFTGMVKHVTISKGEK